MAGTRKSMLSGQYPGFGDPVTERLHTCYAEARRESFWWVTLEVQARNRAKVYGRSSDPAVRQLCRMQRRVGVWKPKFGC